jgi:hypothetical protein
MQILESKQQLLDSTKKSSSSTENKVKQLKSEALAARKELDDLKRRETTLEKERRTTQLEKEKQMQQQKSFEKSMIKTKSENEKELNTLRLELDVIHKNMQQIKQKDIQKQVKSIIEKQVKERENVLKNLENIRKEIELNNQNFVIHVKHALVDLLNQLSSNENDEILTTELENCKNDVNTLVSRIAKR